MEAVSSVKELQQCLAAGGFALATESQTHDANNAERNCVVNIIRLPLLHILIGLTTLDRREPFLSYFINRHFPDGLLPATIAGDSP